MRKGFKIIDEFQGDAIELEMKIGSSRITPHYGKWKLNEIFIIVNMEIKILFIVNQEWKCIVKFLELLFSMRRNQGNFI